MYGIGVLCMLGYASLILHVTAVILVWIVRWWRFVPHATIWEKYFPPWMLACGRHFNSLGRGFHVFEKHFKTKQSRKIHEKSIQCSFIQSTNGSAFHEYFHQPALPRGRGSLVTFEPPLSWNHSSFSLRTTNENAESASSTCPAFSRHAAYLSRYS